MAKPKDFDISHDAVLAALDYDIQTGIFTWKVSRPKARAGQIAGGVTRGYLAIRLFGFSILAHRLAWFYVHATWPIGLLDHINRNPLDNRICNLRAATGSQNNCNSKVFINNKSGVKGVTWVASEQKWWAQLNLNGKRFNSRHQTFEAAVQARKQLEIEHHGEFRA